MSIEFSKYHYAWQHVFVWANTHNQGEIVVSGKEVWHRHCTPFKNLDLQYSLCDMCVLLTILRPELNIKQWKTD